jgi:hypothetical protein
MSSPSSAAPYTEWYYRDLLRLAYEDLTHWHTTSFKATTENCHYCARREAVTREIASVLKQYSSEDNDAVS